MDPQRVRFAPSPTGQLHLGSARTALYNWLIARNSGGSLVLRIEDTDVARNRPEHIQAIFEALEWLGLDYDEGPNYQSQRAERHAQVVQQLLESGQAYHDPTPTEQVKAWKEQNKGQGWRGPAGASQGAVRLRMPAHQEHLVVRDLITGESRWPIASLDDVVIARADGSPLYLLANAVDDIDDRISLICRGSDGAANAPKQLPLFAALGAPEPLYAHVPLVFGPDGAKYSKRHGAASVQERRDQGYLREGLLNALVLLGWGEKDQTVMDVGEMIERFDITRVGKNKVSWDEDRAYWLNGQHLRRLWPAAYAQRLSEYLQRPLDERLRGGAAATQPKVSLLSEAAAQMEYLWAAPDPVAADWSKVGGADAAAALRAARESLRYCAWTAEMVHEQLTQTAERMEIKPGKLFQPLRLALTGSTRSPGIGETVVALPPAEVLARVQTALEALDAIYGLGSIPS